MDLLLMPLAETIKELVSFTLKCVDLMDHTNWCHLCTINHCVILTMCMLSWFFPNWTSSEFFTLVYPCHWNIPTRLLDVCLGNGYLGPDLALSFFWSVNPFEPTILTRSSDALLDYGVFWIRICNNLFLECKLLDLPNKVVRLYVLSLVYSIAQ